MEDLYSDEHDSELAYEIEMEALEAEAYGHYDSEFDDDEDDIYGHDLGYVGGYGGGAGGGPCPDCGEYHGATTTYAAGAAAGASASASTTTKKRIPLPVLKPIKVTEKTFQEVVDCAHLRCRDNFGLSPWDISTITAQLNLPSITLSSGRTIEGKLGFLILLRFLRHGAPGLADSLFDISPAGLAQAAVITMDVLIEQWGHLLDLFNAQRYHLTPKEIERLSWHGSSGSSTKRVSPSGPANVVEGLGERAYVWGVLSPVIRVFDPPSLDSKGKKPRRSDWHIVTSNDGIMYAAGPLKDHDPNSDTVDPVFTSKHFGSRDEPLQDWLMKHSTVDSKWADLGTGGGPSSAVAGGTDPSKDAFLWAQGAPTAYGRVVCKIPEYNRAWRRFLTGTNYDYSGVNISEAATVDAISNLFRATEPSDPTNTAGPRIPLSNVFLVGMLISNLRVCAAADAGAVARFARQPPLLQRYLKPKVAAHKGWPAA